MGVLEESLAPKYAACLNAILLVLWSPLAREDAIDVFLKLFLSSVRYRCISRMSESSMTLFAYMEHF